MKKTMVLITVLVVLTSVSKGMEVDPNRFAPSKKWLYGDSSVFVNAPASLGYYTCYPAGYITGLPFSLFYIGPNYLINCYMVSTIVAHEGLARLGYVILGAPFYLLEKILWDGPVYLYEAVVGEDE